MADIAMLVAEEYERRIKSDNRKARDTPSVAVVVVSAGSVFNLTVDKLREMNYAVVNTTQDVLKGLEPRSQLGVAAFSGFFSA